MNMNYLSSVENDEERADRERQKRKVIGYFANGEDTRVIVEKDYQPGQNEIDRVYEQMSDGEIGEEQEERLLLRIRGRAEHLGAEAVLYGDDERGIEGIMGHRQEQRILALSTDVGFDNYQDLMPDDLEGFLDKYPTPMDYEGKVGEILENIRRSNSEEKYQQYARSVENFQKKVYGKKYDYFLALKEVRAEAEERASYPEFRGDVEAREAEEKLRAKEEMLELERDMDAFRLSGEMAEGMMARTELENDPLIELNGNSKKYTVEDLRKAELEPRYGMTIEGVNMGFSEMFKLEGDRDAVVGYVDMGDGRVYARSYYRSNSQGVWRYMPDRQQDFGGNVVWYGKGQGEEAVTLPSETQMFLNMMGAAQESKAERRRRREKRAEELQDERSDAFFGIAKAVVGNYGWVATGNGGTRPRTYHEAREAGMIHDALGREVRAKARFEFAGHVPPERMRLYSDSEPDFEQQTGEYKMRSRKYGEVQAKMFLSQDGRLKWTMMEDVRGRVWVGQVEAMAPITSTGCRAEWVRAGDFTTPIYEYPQQAKGYGDNSDVLHDARGDVQYVSMWRNYLSKIPMIKRYKETEGRESA